MTLEERFWSHVKKGGPDECWECSGSPGPGGYGRITIGRKNIAAHRMAYQLAVGPIPDRLYILHSCDNRRCCNPAHLHPGTHRENAREAVDRLGMNCGERNGQAKLTPADVLAICQLYVPRRVTYRELASRFGVCPMQVCRIVQGERWARVTKVAHVATR
jgi:hypothetical protein